ncbi:MAG: polysaccharide lyase family 7 protein [Burkholderia gladioli]
MQTRDSSRQAWAASNLKCNTYREGLQLPTGSSGSVTTVNDDSLAAGYTNQHYFYTDKSDGSMVMMDPKQGWTTSGSQHPRTEMRENATWSTSGTNKLDATVTVAQVPKTTTIGQIFQGSGPSKPLCELQVTSGGVAQLFIEDTNQGGSGQTYSIVNVTIGKSFTYELSLSGTKITAKINGTSKSFTMTRASTARVSTSRPAITTRAPCRGRR